MKYLSVLEWRAEGVCRFGEKELEWKFVCPSCGHVQRPEDFRPYKGQGATAESAWQVCIGRYSGGRQAFGGTGNGPCNYTGGGLLQIQPDTVECGVKTIKIFAFAEPDEKSCDSPVA